MIFDTVNNLSLYRGISSNISSAIDFCLSNDLNKLSNGKHKIDGDDVFIIINEYETKDESDCIIETHKKYIDIQIMLQGDEKFGFAFLKNQEIVKDYNVESDCVFYSAKLDYLNLTEGSFAMFFPTDLHSPSIRIGNVKNVKKAVIKVRI